MPQPDFKTFLKNLTSRPGVYRMLDQNDKILYVGKARNLKKRVSSYFCQTGLAPKTLALMKHVRSIDVTVTHTESEALILENNLIKENRPRYNVLLRDDKSYPYIYLSSEDDCPRLSIHRGARRAKGRYFGPYPGAGSVRDTLSLLQKLFPIRQCEDSFYRNRSRPCLQYQIKRCTAPCVGLIEQQVYAEHVRLAVMFLEGKSSHVIEELVEKMEQASAQLEYEKAVVFRNQIATLQRIQERQYISGVSGDLDVVACATEAGVACVQVFFVRDGHHLGNKSFFPKTPAATEPAEILEAFVSGYYLDKPVPEEILVGHPLEDNELIQDLLIEQAGHAVKLHTRTRGDRSRWLQMALSNADNALKMRLLSNKGYQQRLDALRDALDLDEQPQRMECFDISHTSGEATVASCVVFDQEGPRKVDYRRFNIKDITPGDDYAAMEQALTRRYTRLKKGEGYLPDILFIDGGKGQIGKARKVIDELQVEGVMIVGVAKGEGRKPGLETLFLSGRASPIILHAEQPALHLIQQIRDEAHRFAITGHRARRDKARKTSFLEGITGMGPKRRQRILKHFGGLKELERAGIEDFARVPGISRQLAQRIYDALHTEAS
ncbi:MAG TPA: excinuclease ABC subunit UvrC [Gammaproteobacteria bacterium]|nr:excinuclease ABC subunit UvrC [Gammaproteobacteria bacterium]